MGAPDKDNKKNAMISLIEQGEDGIRSTTNVLALVWRIILYKYGLSAHSWQRHITRYQERVDKQSSRKGSANMKGNMQRRLAEDRLSWGSLMRGFSILEFERVEITFKTTKRYGNKLETRDVTIVINDDELNAVDNNDDDI